MSRLIESIRIFRGQANNLNYHQERMDRTSRALYGHKASDLKTALDNIALPSQGLHKCRVIYEREILSVETNAYVMRQVQSLRLVTDNEISYNYKFEDRSGLQKLYVDRGSCDEIIIVRNGLVTDSSYANVIFLRGDEWITPASFLLNGTQRQYLLDRNAIKEEVIRADDIKKFSACKLINAMMLAEAPEIPMSNVYSN